MTRAGCQVHKPYRHKQAIAQAQRVQQRMHIPLSVFRCTYCGSWHISSHQEPASP